MSLSRTANDLFQSKAITQDAAGKKVFEEQIEGKTTPKPAYPDGVNRDDLMLRLFGPNYNTIAEDDLQGPGADSLVWALDPINQMTQSNSPCRAMS